MSFIDLTFLSKQITNLTERVQSLGGLRMESNSTKWKEFVVEFGQVAL